MRLMRFRSVSDLWCSANPVQDGFFFLANLKLGVVRAATRSLDSLVLLLPRKAPPNQATPARASPLGALPTGTGVYESPFFPISVLWDSAA